MSTSDNGACQCCPWCPYSATSTGNRNMGLETEAGATDMKSFTCMADLETTSNGHGNNNTNNSTCSAAKVVDAGKSNNNNKERISLADAARETRKTRAAAAALLRFGRSGTAMGSSSLTRRERKTNWKESAVPILNARTKKVSAQDPY